MTRCIPVDQFFAVEHFPLYIEAKEKFCALLPPYARPAAMIVRIVLMTRTEPITHEQITTPFIHRRPWAGAVSEGVGDENFVENERHDDRLPRNLGFSSISLVSLVSMLRENMAAG
jgi:hypothetical protein